MKRILVTGSAGFIGSQCLSLLRLKGFQVHAADVKKIETLDSEVKWHRLDLLDSGEVSLLLKDLRPTHLLHLAWDVTPGQYWSSLSNIKWLEASLRLVREFQRSGGERFVGAGTCAEYDWSGGVCSEKTTPLRPGTLYGSCKLALGEVLRTLTDNYGMSSAWGRLFYLYGPREHSSRLVPSVINRLLNGDTAPCTSGEQKRDFLHVNDVAEALCTLMDSNVSGPINIGSGVSIPVKEIITAIGDYLGVSHLIKFGEIIMPANEPMEIRADTQRLFNELEWRPRMDFHKGIKQTIEWWKDRINGKTGI